MRKVLFVAAATLLIASLTAAGFRLWEGRDRYREVASVRDLSLGPAPAPLARIEPAPPQFVEPSTPEEAVTRFIEAESRGQLDLSYALLDERSRRAYPVLASWQADQAQRPRPLGITSARRADASAGPDGADRAEVAVGVERRPTVDPFVGFVAARATETWQARQQDGRWRVEDRAANIEPEIPSDAGVATTVSDWVASLRGCQPAAAALLQVEPVLYGVPDLADQLCRNKQAAPTIGEVEQFDSMAEGAEVLNAFGVGIDDWARVVDVDAGQPFRLTLAPLGDAWRVLSISALTAAEVGR